MQKPERYRETSEPPLTGVYPHSWLGIPPPAPRPDKSTNRDIVGKLCGVCAFWYVSLLSGFSIFRVNLGSYLTSAFSSVKNQ